MNKYDPLERFLRRIVEHRITMARPAGQAQ